MNTHTDIRNIPFTDGEHQVIFGSLAEMADLSEARGPKDRGSTGKSAHYVTWSYSDSAAAAAALAREGWPDGVRRISDMSGRITESVSRRTEAHSMDLYEEGGEVDVAAYLDGQRACMWTWAEQENRRPVVRVSVNIAAASKVKPESYIVAGAAICSLIDALEANGRRVELDLHCTIKAHPMTLTTSVRLKEAGQQLDMGTIAYGVAHPSMLRRTLFGVWEHAPGAWRDAFGFYAGRGYGWATESPAQLRGDVHVDVNDAAKLDPEGAHEWVLDNLRQQGIEVSE